MIIEVELEDVESGWKVFEVKKLNLGDCDEFL